MSAMMMSNPTRKTLLEATMSMMTTVTPVLHRDVEHDWSSSLFSTVQVACIQGVMWSSRYCCLLDWVARPCTDLCSNALLQGKPRNSSFPTLYCLSLACRSAYILVRACAVGIAHPRGSTPVLFRNCASARNLSSILLF